VIALYIASETLFIESRRHTMLSDDQLAPQNSPSASKPRPNTGSKNSPRLPAVAAPFSQRRPSSEYLDVNQTQVSCIKGAIASLDRGEAVSHEIVRKWVLSW
jgi:hypothetical protein